MGSGVGKENREQDSGTSKKWLHPEAKAAAVTPPQSESEREVGGGRERNSQAVGHQGVLKGEFRETPLLQLGPCRPGAGGGGRRRRRA